MTIIVIDCVVARVLILSFVILTYKVIVYSLEVEVVPKVKLPFERFEIKLFGIVPTKA